MVLTWTFYSAAGDIGPVILGRAFDATRSYAPLLVFLAAALGLAAATTLCFLAIQIRLPLRLLIVPTWRIIVVLNYCPATATCVA